MSILSFKHNPTFSMGVELELQLVNLHDFNLTMEAEDFLRRFSQSEIKGVLKPEITQSMIEVNSSVHENYSSLLSELFEIRDALVTESRLAHIGICGGGTHPFQKWMMQRIFKSERFSSLSDQYGYLAKQFTVFGQHIHIGCQNGDDALYLCHALARYIPHFIALSAASPFSQRVDTQFDCSRLAVISAFPLSGTPPWMQVWSEFEAYYQRMMDLGVITSMKDFYWDIRPKPEFGTVEIRICDTPLSVVNAANLAAYAQMLSCWLLRNKSDLSRDIYLTYLVNRFRAARYGLNAEIIDPLQQHQVMLAEDILNTCCLLEPIALELDAQDALKNLLQAVINKRNDARWLREQFQITGTLNDTVREQVRYWQEC